MADVVTGTVGTAGDAGSTAATLINDLKTEFIAVAHFGNELEQLFKVEPITNAKTKQWNRMERLSIAATPATATEGVTPDAVGLTINSVTAVLEQYITAVKLSELSEATTRNPLVQGAIRTLGLAAKEVRAHVLYNIANAATNTFRVNDRANDDAIELGDLLTVEETSRVRAVLAAAGTPPYPDGGYRMVIPPHVQSGLELDPNWQARHQLVNNEALATGATQTTVMGVSIKGTTDNSFVSSTSTTTGNSNKIYTSIIAGPDALAVTDLMSTQLYVTEPGRGETDHAHQRWTISFKMTFKSVVLDNTFLRRIRSAGKDGAAAP